MTPTDIASAVAQILVDTAKLHAVIHGGVTDVISTEGGNVPSLAKAISDLSAAITAGNASGFVAVAANAAARLALVPAQQFQLLIQSDTKAIYYAPSTVVGSWIFHPIQNAAANADAATAAVATLTTALAAKMTAATYVGDSATGSVHKADFLAQITAFIIAHAHTAQNALIVENGAQVVTPLLQNNRGVGLIDGVARHGAVSSTSRRALGLGSNFAFVNNPARLISWGAQGKGSGGTLASGLAATQSYYARPVVAQQQPDRNLPDFDSGSIFTAAGAISKMSSQGAVTVVLTTDGLILVSGANAQGVKSVFGSGVDKLQTTLMPVFFNDGSGVNHVIKLFDVQDSTSTNTDSTAIFADTSDNIWLLTSNPRNAGYGNSLSGAQNVPFKLNTGYGAWSGKIAKKVRCDVSGGIYILWTDGTLWAGGGSNAAGLLGTGSTTNVLNPLQIATSVSDFEVTGQESGASLSLWYLTTGNVLMGAGYNANGQMGQTSGPTANKSSFVSVATNVDMVRLGGTDTVTLFYRDLISLTWSGLGKNSDGTFGQGASAANNNVPVVLTNLTTIITSEGLVHLCISGYNGKHSTCLVTTAGNAYTAGNNSDGVLANGVTTATNTFKKVLWSPRDNEEKIVDVSSCVDANGAPAFLWLTNQGRLLGAGAADKGFATGVTPPAAHNILVASPIQINTV